MIKQAIKTVMKKAGYRWWHHTVLPKGIDLCLDVQRLVARQSIRTIIDVGAHEGQTSIHLADQFPAASIHALEPIAESFRKARENTSRFPSISLHHLAAGAERGNMEIFLQADSQTNSLSPQLNVASNLGTGSRETINITTLDEFAVENHLQSIDLLKIDAEAYEEQVLQGAQNLFREQKVRFLFIEVGFRKEDTGHTDFGTVREILEKAGFVFYSLYDLYHYNHVAELLFANALFIHLDTYNRA